MGQGGSSLPLTNDLSGEWRDMDQGLRAQGEQAGLEILKLRLGHTLETTRRL